MVKLQFGSNSFLFSFIPLEPLFFSPPIILLQPIVPKQPRSSFMAFLDSDHTRKKKDKPIWPRSRWKTEKKNNGEEMGSQPGPQHKKHLPYHCSAPTFVLNLVLIFFYSTRCKFGGKRGHGETGLRT